MKTFKSNLEHLGCFHNSISIMHCLVSKLRCSCITTKVESSEVVLWYFEKLKLYTEYYSSAGDMDTNSLYRIIKQASTQGLLFS